MTHEFDEAAANLPEYQLSEAARRQHLRLLAQLDAEPERTPFFRRRWVLVLSAIVGLSGIGVSTAAAFGLFSAVPGDRRIAHCYATADLNAPDNHYDFSVAQSTGEANPSIPDAANSARAICRQAWMSGQVSSTEPYVLIDPPTPPPPNSQVPMLTACVLDSGEVAIFPGRADVCAQLGLPVAQV